jgi:dolichol-phosphate mannosyltransferase
MLHPSDRTEEGMPLVKLSILIPTYNEAKTLPILLDRVLSVPVEKELVIVDDGSTDETGRILEGYQSVENILIIRHDRNLGKGSAVRTAIPHITGEIAVIQDADLEYDPMDFPRLMEPIQRGEARVVYGVRKFSPYSYWTYALGGRFLSLLTSILFGQPLRDVNTCYKMIDPKLLKSLPLEGTRFDLDLEITARIARQGIRIHEIPIRYKPRSFQEGKKICWKDGAVAVGVLLKVRFTG